MSTALRIVDANANRVREALRTLEDIVRFEFNDAVWSAVCKGLRHDFAAALAGLPAADLLAARDTPGDVGTTISTAAEGDRPSQAAVVTAACKRVQEALRSIEEQAKSLPGPGPTVAAAVEQLRYRAYDLEAKLAGRLHRAGRLGGLRLYVLLTEALCRRPWRDVARAALDGGADVIQLREKAALPDGELLARAGWLADLCRAAGRLFVVNDRADIAALVGADGVHVGQDDLPVSAARRLLGGTAVIGLSTHSVAQAQDAVRAGADLIGVGPMYATATKPQAAEQWGVVGPALLREVTAAVSVPVVAIGGITAANVGPLVQAGARCVAVSSAVIGAEDPAAAAAAIRRQMLA